MYPEKATVSNGQRLQRDHRLGMRVDANKKEREEIKSFVDKLELVEPLEP